MWVLVVKLTSSIDCSFFCLFHFLTDKNAETKMFLHATPALCLVMLCLIALFRWSRESEHIVQWLIGTHEPLVTVHPTSLCSALLQLSRKKAASPWIHDGFETLLWSLKLTTTCAYWPFVKVLGTLCINLWTAILTCARVTRSSWGMLLLAKPTCVLCCCCCCRRPDGSCITVPASCQWFPRHGEAVKHPPICSH